MEWSSARHGTCCPLGLLPTAMFGHPIARLHFGGDPPVSDQAIREFYWWWDQQTDAVATMDVVWPAHLEP